VKEGQREGELFGFVAAGPDENATAGREKVRKTEN
jgi:hypothetical protein